MWLGLVASIASACGGFFCDTTPVMQAAERVVFGIDEGAGLVEMHVQISFAGEEEEFGWVLPVAGVPELFLSTDDLFSGIYFPTNPSYTLAVEEEGACLPSERNATGSYPAPSSSTDGGGVSVVSEEIVGPYQTAVLQASSEAELLAWLDEAGYVVPPGLDGVLAPYVAANQYFVALKLLAGRTVGELAPLGLVYAGDQASIPIQLTSVAALPDTRLEVYVFGGSRAVPESYLHVIPNDMAYDFFDQTVTYEDVVTRAADEAGGHAFATDWSGSTDLLRGTVWPAERFDLGSMALAPDIFTWMDAFFSGYGYVYAGYGQAVVDPNALGVLRQVAPLPDTLASQGVTETSFWTCLRCYDEEAQAIAFDAGSATELLEDTYVEPLRRAEDLFATFTHGSRLTSSLDAVEMTVDPVFTFNADMPQEVEVAHAARVVAHCGDSVYSAYEAPRTLYYPDGTAVDLPSAAWFDEAGVTEYEYLSDLAAYAARVIEATGSSGDPEVLTDRTQELKDLAAALSAQAAAAADGGEEAGGCGCAAARPGPGWLALGLAALVRRRARR